MKNSNFDVVYDAKLTSRPAGLASRPGRVATDLHEICLDIRLLDAIIVAIATNFWSSITSSRPSIFRTKRLQREDLPARLPGWQPARPACQVVIQTSRPGRDRFSERSVVKVIDFSTSSSTTRRSASPAARLASRPGRVGRLSFELRVVEVFIDKNFESWSALRVVDDFEVRILHF